MKSFATSIMIDATPERVWKVLTDGAGWLSWNPTIEKLEGVIAPGAKVKVYSKIAPGRAFLVRVSEFVPPRLMVWAGGMPLGLFKGVRTYTLTPTDGGVEFAMREAFSGPLSSLIARSIPDLQPSFDEFAAALKRRAEQRA
ncbi:MAG TPA: SRPBCC domain-containing protein [Pirellulales bacterium]|nr:SRPBCC domain-containing protein [Pirellulales bacterium]